jgi:hypothetical protein
MEGPVTACSATSDGIDRRELRSMMLLAIDMNGGQEKADEFIRRVASWPGPGCCLRGPVTGPTPAPTTPRSIETAFTVPGCRPRREDLDEAEIARSVIEDVPARTRSSSPKSGPSQNGDVEISSDAPVVSAQPVWASPFRSDGSPAQVIFAA